jgi:hypothetical protein
MNYTTFEMGCLPRGGMRKKRISTPQDSDIADTKFMWIPLYHDSRTNGRDPSFPDSLPTYYTTSNLTTYLEVVLGSSKYNHQDGDITNTGMMLVLLDHGSMVDERDPSIFYYLSRQFAHELHYIEDETIGINIHCVVFPTVL